MGKKNKKSLQYKWILGITCWTFILAMVISLASQTLTDYIESILVSFAILILIILVGVLADIVGIAATSAEEKPFHAKAAKKVSGAKEAIFFVRNADIVSNFSSDVIGDISGIVSGSLGAFIVFQLAGRYPGMSAVTLSIILTAAIASLTVGGKAAGKTLAITRSTEIILFVSSIFKGLKRMVGR